MLFSVAFSLSLLFSLLLFGFSVARPAPTSSSPPPADVSSPNSLLIMPAIHEVYALNPETGKVVWSFGDPDTSNFMAPPVWVNGTVYVSDLFTIRALDPATGHVRWNHTYPVPHRLDGASPAVGSSGLFFCDEDGYLYRLDAHTGEQLWKMHLPVMDTPTIASDGTVYLALANQSTVLAMHSNGSIKWALTAEKYTYFSSGISMSRSEETLYLTLDCIYLIAVSRANGTRLWMSHFGEEIAYCPIPAEYSTLPSVGLDDLVGVAVGPYVGIVAPNGTLVSNCMLNSANSDMVAVDGAAYLTTWKSVFRYSYANSSIVWQTRVVPDPNFKFAQGATLGRGGRTVYVPDGNYVLALEASTGRILWNTTVGPQTTTAFYTSGVACECPPPYTVTRCNSACYLG